MYLQSKIHGILDLHHCFQVCVQFEVKHQSFHENSWKVPSVMDWDRVSIRRSNFVAKNSSNDMINLSRMYTCYVQDKESSLWLLLNFYRLKMCNVFYLYLQGCLWKNSNSNPCNKLNNKILTLIFSLLSIFVNI